MTTGNIYAGNGHQAVEETEGTIEEMSARRPWRTPRLPELVGSKGACEILNVQKMTLNRWLRAGSGTLGPDRTYMIPPRRVDDGTGDLGWPVWAKSDVERFAVEIGRQRAPAGTVAGT